MKPFFLIWFAFFACSQTEVSVDNQTENILDDVVEEFKEDTVKPKVKKKKKQKEGMICCLNVITIEPTNFFCSKT